jgi:hypothetical protein
LPWRADPVNFRLAFLQGIIMKRIVIAAAFAVALPLGLASAAGPFDGQYTGGAPATGARGAACPIITGTVSVVDGKLSGKFSESRYTFNMTGTVSPDGTMTGKWAAYPMTGKFTGGHFEGTYNSKECGTERRITLDKAG